LNYDYYYYQSDTERGYKKRGKLLLRGREYGEVFFFRTRGGGGGSRDFGEFVAVVVFGDRAQGRGGMVGIELAVDEPLAVRVRPEDGAVHVELVNLLERESLGLRNTKDKEKENESDT
jgi:hypothetical protein